MTIGNSSLTKALINQTSNLSNLINKNNEKLSSGLKINRASDDVVGLAISEKMRAQIRGLDMSTNNATDAISLIQVAESGLSAITDILQRMNELSIKASNGIYTYEDRVNIASEFEECKEEIDRIAETTTFNGKKLLDMNVGETRVGEAIVKAGTATMAASIRMKMDFSTIGDGNLFVVDNGETKYKFEFDYDGKKNVTDAIAISLDGKETNEEIAHKLEDAMEATNLYKVTIVKGYPNDGKNYTVYTLSKTPKVGEKINFDMISNGPLFKIGGGSDDYMSVNLKAVKSENLGIDNTNILTTEGAIKATDSISTALGTISEVRANLGAAQNRLEYSINRLRSESENTTAAESRIRDVDMAREIVYFTKNQILQKSALAMLSQANQQRGSVLKLIKTT